MVRTHLLFAALLSLALAPACQRAESSSRDKAPSNEESEAVAAVAARAPTSAPKPVAEAVHRAPEADHHHAAGEEHSCGQGESCGGGCGRFDEEATEVVKREVPEDAVWHTLKVTGMHCAMCERRIIAHVGKLAGVVSVEADAELGVVRVAVAKGAEKPTRLAAAKIRDLGYGVEGSTN